MDIDNNHVFTCIDNNDYTHTQRIVDKTSSSLKATLKETRFGILIQGGLIVVIVYFTSHFLKPLQKQG